jgi:hypothetical protein
MIAEYQVDKLERRLSEHVRAHTFKYDGKWYKLSIKVEELSLDSGSNYKSLKTES